MPSKRYIAAKTITNAGEYYDRTGRWTVTDTAVDAPDHCSWAVMTGTERQAKRWARDLNARP